jgi:hypothetical protein
MRWRNASRAFSGKMTSVISACGPEQVITDVGEILTVQSIGTEMPKVSGYVECITGKAEF